MTTSLSLLQSVRFSFLLHFFEKRIASCHDNIVHEGRIILSPAKVEKDSQTFLANMPEIGALFNKRQAENFVASDRSPH
jgi:hypothetical protein